MAWLLLCCAIASEVTASLSLNQLAQPNTNRRLWLTVVTLGYLSSFSFLSLTLHAGIPLGVAYGVWTAAGVALTAAASWLFWGEKLTWLRALGFALIIGGVLLVESGV